VIEIIARSEAMSEAVRLADRVAGTDANVLITGESGVGKDALAFYIHTQSARAAHSFVKIDCATLPSGLLEAELFGYERGAFTGAGEEKPGRLEASHRGTLVLDEIAYLSIESQAKLLRVIETREFERLGGRKLIKVDARLIALTNVDLGDAIKRRQFREDLYHRLHVVHIIVPPLRDRADDLPELAQAFARAYAAKHGRQASEVAPEALALLGAYEFPGNVRELANTVERAVIVSTGRQIEANDLPEPIRAAVRVQQQRVKPQTLAEVEADYVAEVLALTKGNKAEAARVLGISRKSLHERLARRERMKDERGMMNDE
jgi:DNA-binding NtrC family response regulator